MTFGRKPHSLNVCVSAELGRPQTGRALPSQPDSFRGVTGHGGKQGRHIPVGLGKPGKVGSLQWAELDIPAPKLCLFAEFRVAATEPRWAPQQTPLSGLGAQRLGKASVGKGERFWGMQGKLGHVKTMDF